MKEVCSACGMAYDTEELEECPNCEHTDTWDEPL